MPEMPELSGTTLWAAAALLVLLLLLVICVVAVRRSGSSSVAALFAVPALVVIAWSVWSFADHSILRQRVEEREALNARALQLATVAMAPGSALACLDAGAGDLVDASCEAAVFGKPENVAAATAYVEARLRLLADSLDYSRRADRSYGNTLVHLRRGIEADRYGFVAHVLATRDGCTADACDTFSLLRDPKLVKANIAARTLEKHIARHAARWSDQGPAPVAAGSPAQLPAAAMTSAVPPAAVISPVPVTKPIDFPSAASIPPVSIMTEPPGASAPKPNAPSSSTAARPQ
jgi:hypothetical protein